MKTKQFLQKVWQFIKKNWNWYWAMIVGSTLILLIGILILLLPEIPNSIASDLAVISYLLSMGALFIAMTENETNNQEEDEENNSSSSS